MYKVVRRMDELRQELIDAIVEVNKSTGLALQDCIDTAKDILHNHSRNNYCKNLHLQMFASWS